MWCWSPLSLNETLTTAMDMMPFWLKLLLLVADGLLKVCLVHGIPFYNFQSWQTCWKILSTSLIECRPPSFFWSLHIHVQTIMVLSYQWGSRSCRLLNSKVSLPHLLIHLFYMCLIPTDLINWSMEPTMAALNMAAPAMAAPTTVAKLATAAAAVTAASMLLASHSCF